MSWDSRTIGVFLEAARSGSLGQTARALNMTQPAVTRILKRLEATLGVPLFERSATGVIPTVFGEALLPYAALVSSEIENAAALMDLMRGASKGVIRVGGVGSVTSTYLAPAVHRLRARAPDLQVQIIEEIEDKLAESLVNGTIDIALSPDLPLDERITFACEDALSDEVAAYGAPHHPLGRLTRVSLAQSAQADWALPPADTPVTREWRRRHLAAGVDVASPVVISRSVNTLKALTVEGGVLCWMPRSLVVDELALGHLVELALPELVWQRNFHVYRRRQGHLPPPARLLVGELQSATTARARLSED